jgi:hypothetical protein
MSGAGADVVSVSDVNEMGLPEVGAADVIDTEVTGATVTVGAPVEGMDEVDGNIVIAPAEGMIEVVGNIVIAPIGDSVVDVIGAGLGSGASSTGGLGSGVSSTGGLGSGVSSIGAGLGADES